MGRRTPPRRYRRTPASGPSGAGLLAFLFTLGGTVVVAFGLSLLSGLRFPVSCLLAGGVCLAKLYFAGDSLVGYALAASCSVVFAAFGLFGFFHQPATVPVWGGNPPAARSFVYTSKVDGPKPKKPPPRRNGFSSDEPSTWNNAVWPRNDYTSIPSFGAFVERSLIPENNTLACWLGPVFFELLILVLALQNRLQAYDDYYD